MQNIQTLQPQPLPRVMSVFIWAIVAVFVGFAFALTGMPGLLITTGLALLVVFGAIAAKFPSVAMGVSIWCLALVPYSWGLQTGVIPKVFGDEALLLAYVVVIPFLYLFSKRSWRHGFTGMYLLLAVLVAIEALSLAVSTDLIAIRNFAETIVLGSILLVVFMQEASNINAEKVGNFVVGIAVVLSVLSVIEQVLQRNPIVEGTDRYISSDLVRLTEGIYRPYLSFFHPSETATFVALGVPFVIRAWMLRKTWLSSGALLIVIAGVLANATRGVWAGLAFAAVFELRYAWVPLTLVSIVGGICTWFVYLAFKSAPFFERLTDPRDLFARFEYWRVAGKVFLDHPLLGVGHMQFNTVYLDYILALNNSVDFNFTGTNVADNIFLTTAVEHGILGLGALVAVLLYLAFQLRKYRKALSQAGMRAQSTFVRCSEVSLVLYVAIGMFADVHLFTKATKFFFILVALGLAEGIRYAPAPAKPKAKTEMLLLTA